MKIAIAGATLSFLFIVLPLPALAATNSLLNPIVPAVCHCDNQKDPNDPSKTISTAAGYGCVLQTVQNGVNVLISIAIVVCVLWLAYAGALFMASSANPGLREQGKTRIMNAVIGMVVILAAWLIVDFVMKTLYNEDSKFGPWNSILVGKSDGSDACIVATKSTALTTGSLSIVTGAPGTLTSSIAGGGNGERCVTIPDAQLTTIDSSGHKLIPEAAQRFNAMKAAAAKDNVTITVTSAYRTPEEQTAAWNNNGCHVEAGRAVCKTLTAAIPCSEGGGGSNHSTGVAIDVGRGAGLTWVTAHGSAYGFINALPNDPIHFSQTGK